jgi:hypothetical protein
MGIFMDEQTTQLETPRVLNSLSALSLQAYTCLFQTQGNILELDFRRCIRGGYSKAAPMMQLRSLVHPLTRVLPTSAPDPVLETQGPGHRPILKKPQQRAEGGASNRHSSV